MLEEPGQKLTKMLIGSLHAENEGGSLNKTVFPRNQNTTVNPVRGELISRRGSVLPKQQKPLYCADLSRQ